MVKYSELNLGQIEAVVNKIGGMSGIKRLLSNELVVVERSSMKRFVNTADQFPTFKTITISVYGADGVNKLRDDLKTPGNDISSGGEDLLRLMPLLKEQDTFELVVVSATELGLEYGATPRQIYERASERGLDLCPAQVGPELYRLYKDQPQGDRLYIAMEQVIDSRGRKCIFAILRNRPVRWLRAIYAGPDSGRFSHHRRWVFVRRK